MNSITNKSSKPKPIPSKNGRRIFFPEDASDKENAGNPAFGNNAMAGIPSNVNRPTAVPVFRGSSA